MESFQFTKFPSDQSSYNLEVEGLHQSEESHIETESTPGFSENVELPLPPGTSGDEFFISLGYKPEAFETSNTGQQISNEVKSKSDSFEASNLPFGPQLPSTYTNISEKPHKNESGSAVDSGSKSFECLGDIRYSPSKVDSDEENQDVASKPKLLGKEQAKKRLMAFSVAKQSATSAKKQNKTTPAKSKEKPPNPNKGTNFQEQFRATISAIEEEKKKIYQNMPDYLLQEMKKLVKGQIVSSPSLKSSNKKNKDSKRKSSRHDSTSNKSNDRRRSSRRSKSRSRSRGRGRVRRSRSRSRSNGAHSKNKKRSWSKSRRSRSPGKKPREEKPIKTEQTKSGKIEKDCISKKEVYEDWKSYKLSGAAMESDSALLKNECHESETQEQELDNTSPGVRSHFKPIFNYLKKGYHKMTPLRAKLADSNNGKPALFPEKTIKFTRTKPIIIWTENPTLATDYYMPKEVLLENCPSGSDQILRFIIEGKNSELNGDEVQLSSIKSRPWYPRGKHLPAISPCSSEKTESLPQKSSQEDQSKEVDVQTSKRKISLVNEDYLSDEVEQEEITVGGVKVQLDLEMNTVKVRSKWDSDFEDGNNEKETSSHKTGSKEIPRGEKRMKSKEKLADDFDVERLHRSPEKEPQLLTESPVRKDSNSHPGYLASEYEEFLKMVSFDSKDTQDSQTEKLTQYEIEKMRKMEKPVLENDKNLKLSVDWDRESEQEEELKISIEKPKAGEKLLKPEKLKKKRNQIEKPKPKKKKIIKKTSKVKKYKYKDSYSDDSSSSESESDSESDSTESRSSKEKKRKKSDSRRKKILKGKKKSKKYSSDKSESDSDGGKTKKKKKTKKKDESSDSDESEDKLLKQIDLKKQLIMKKVEQIDTVMEKIDKKKGKENESKKECSEKDKGLKPGKKKNKNIKKNKLKKLKKTETESDSVSSRESTKKKKTKKEIKKKRYSSESSDSEEEIKYNKTKSSKYKRAKKEKKKKGKKYSSSSESEESSASKKLKKKKTEGLNLSKDLKSSIPVIQTDLKVEERLTERGRKFLKKKEKKTKKEDDDWETSSSSLEPEEECESSWDEEGKTLIKLPEIGTIKEKGVDAVAPEKGGSEKNLPCNGNLNSGSENLKNSLSNFSFNENSFCGFGQELSRDFFLTERSFSSSANIGTCANAGLTPIDARPFQCIGKGGENKVIESELYSPGCSDSEVSDTEAKSQKSKTESPTKDVYDPLNCDSEGSGDNNEVELSRIPLPTVADTSRPEEAKQPQNVAISPVLKVNNEVEKTLPSNTSPLKFLANEFSLISNPPPNENSPKKQIMNFKGQLTLKTKAASVFQDDSDEENKEPEKTKEEEKYKKTDKETEDKKRSKNETRDGSKERDRKRSSSREIVQKSPCKTPEASKREIRSDSFEIEPLKSVSNDIVESVQPIPVLLGVSSSNRVWSGSLPGYEFPQVSDSLVDQAESFDIYPSEESKYPSEDYIRDDTSVDKATEKSVKRRKSRSRSLSPKKKRKSKSPVRRRSPKRWSVSPKHRDKSPRSPRRRSPKRKSPPRRRSRSPSRRRKSRRLSSPRRSRSKSPSKRRSPKRWDSPPRRKDSPSRGYSPRRDAHYPTYTDLPYWVPPVGTSEKDEDMEVSPPGASSPQYDNSMAFPRMPASSISEAEMNNSFYEGEYVSEYGVNTYREEIGMNNLITVKNHSVEKIESPRRPSLDQRIELELGSPISSSSSQFPSQPPQTFEGSDPIHYQTYNCDSSGASENFYQNQTIPDFNGQYFNEVPPANYGSYPYPHPPPQPQPPPPSVQNAVMQVGNIVEVVPALQHPLRPSLPPPKAPQIMQVGNVLQVVPTQKVATPAPVPPPILDHESLPSSPVVKTQKATAVVAPSSVVPPPNLEAMINPLIKAILLEREKRRKEKEKRRLEREARRKARQLRREAKLMSVSEKLKKSVQNEGLVLGQEVEDDELLDAMDIPSPPVPVQIITVSSPSAASPAGKGILITAGFVSKSPSKKKEVKFADGVYPGEGTSSSGEEDIPLSPPKPKLPKEKPFKKKKIKVKKKVKVHIIKQILHEEEEDDEDDDNLSPPPPPPGDPPPVFFARFPFAGNAQFPVYQTQTTTTTTTTTTFQYPAQAI